MAVPQIVENPTRETHPNLQVERRSQWMQETPATIGKINSLIHSLLQKAVCLFSNSIIVNHFQKISSLVKIWSL